MAVGAFGATGVAGADPPPQAGPRGERYIVGTTHGSSSVASDMAERVDNTVDFGDDIGEAVAGRWSESDLETLEQHSEVRYVEVDRVVTAGTPTEPSELTWGTDRVDSDVARNEGDTGSGVDVAILDTGIDTDHPDLQANLGTGHAEVNCVDGGVPDGPCQEDWDDDDSHGTHVAGTVGAVANDSQVVGVAPEVTLHAIKVLDNTGSGSWANLCAGMNTAINEGYDVMNMSIWAEGAYGDPVQCIDDAMQHANNEDVLVVGIAGNDGGDSVCSDDDCVAEPATHPDIFAVSSIDPDETLSGFSSVGPQVPFAGPGGQVPSTVPGGGVGQKGGTSMAAPHVTGAVALLLANGVAPDDVESELSDSAEDVGLPDHAQGAGLIDVANALDHPSIETSLIVDRSGSMSGSKITDAKNAAELYTGLSNMDANISVVSYASSSRVDQEMIQLGTDDGETGTNTTGRTRVRNAIGGIGAGGSTNIYSGLDDALGQLDEAQEDSAKVAILLSDGQHNTGPSESDILNDLVPEFNDKDYCLYTVAFGSGADEQFLQELADRVDCGGFRSTGGDERLSDIYADIRQEVTGDTTLEQTSGTIPAGSTVTGTVSIGESTDSAAFRIEVTDTQSASTTPEASANALERAGNEQPPIPASQQPPIPTSIDQPGASIELKDPSGSVVTDGDENVETSVVDDTKIYRVNDPAAGDWQYELANSGSSELAFEVEVTGDVPTSCVPQAQASRSTPEQAICDPRDLTRATDRSGTAGSSAADQGEKRKRDTSRNGSTGSGSDGDRSSDDSGSSDSGGSRGGSGSSSGRGGGR